MLRRIAPSADHAQGRKCAAAAARHQATQQPMGRAEVSGQAGILSCARALARRIGAHYPSISSRTHDQARNRTSDLVEPPSPARSCGRRGHSAFLAGANRRRRSPSRSRPDHRGRRTQTELSLRGPATRNGAEIGSLFAAASRTSSSTPLRTGWNRRAAPARLGQRGVRCRRGLTGAAAAHASPAETEVRRDGNGGRLARRGRGPALCCSRLMNPTDQPLQRSGLSLEAGTEMEWWPTRVRPPTTAGHHSRRDGRQSQACAVRPRPLWRSRPNIARHEAEHARRRLLLLTETTGRPDRGGVRAPRSRLRQPLTTSALTYPTGRTSRCDSEIPRSVLGTAGLHGDAADDVPGQLGPM